MSFYRLKHFSIFTNLIKSQVDSLTTKIFLLMTRKLISLFRQEIYSNLKNTLNYIEKDDI